MERSQCTNKRLQTMVHGVHVHSFILSFFHSCLLRYYAFNHLFPALEEIRGSHPVLRFMHGHEHLSVLHTLAFAGFDDFAVLSSQRQGNRLPFWRF